MLPDQAAQAPISLVMQTPDTASLHLLGYVSRLHGYKGELVLVMEATPGRSFKPEWLFCEIDGGPVPFGVSRFAVNGNSAVVKFDDVDNEKAAIQLRGLKVFSLDVPGFKKADTEKDSVRGYVVEDETLGTIGTVNDIISYPQHEVFSVIRKGKEVLIPASEPILVKVNKRKKTIVVNLPDGLLALYDAE